MEYKIDEEIIRRLMDNATEEEMHDGAIRVLDHRFDDFLNAVKSTEKLVRYYENAGSDFKSEYRQAKRDYETLTKLGEWLLKYNTTQPVKGELYEATRVVQLKAYIDKIELAEHKDRDDYVAYSGFFTPVKVIAIPLEWIGIDNVYEWEPKQVLKRFQEVAMGYYKDDRLPSDSVAYYGAPRVISNTHFAVVAVEQENSLAKYIKRQLNWRYIHCDGYAS